MSVLFISILNKYIYIKIENVVVHVTKIVHSSVHKLFSSGVILLCLSTTILTILSVVSQYQ